MKMLEMKSDVIYRCIGPDFTNGILACGYMSKPTKEKSQYNFVIDYYSCFLLLSGSGYYIADNGVEVQFTQVILYNQFLVYVTLPK